MYDCWNPAQDQKVAKDRTGFLDLLHWLLKSEPRFLKTKSSSPHLSSGIKFSEKCIRMGKGHPHDLLPKPFAS